MFTGKYSVSLNSKDQLTLPHGFAARLLQGAVITQGFDCNLMVLSHQSFQDLTGRILSMNLTDPIARMLLRMLLGNASEVTLDESGQLSIPPTLCQVANLQSPAILVGMGDFFEIWSAEGWTAAEARLVETGSDPGCYSSLSLSMR